MRVVQQN